MLPNTKGSRKKHYLYDTYCNMKSRCYCKNRWNYKFYGGKGIKVDQRWLGERGFDYFLLDMGERPKGFQLDRINPNGNYSKDNCRWVNKYIQMGNTTKNNPVPGVGWHSQRGKWRARIKIGGKEKSLGLFQKYEDAVKARQTAYYEICRNDSA